MLAVLLFAAFWVLLGLSLFFIASRGGLGGARAALQTQVRRPRKVINFSFLVMFIAFGVAIPLAILTGNHANASSQVGGIRLNAPEKVGRQLFGQHCSVCHTLAAANATGKVGPNLDQLRPPASLVYNTILNGCVQDPQPGASNSCLGYGTMPAGVLEPQDATKVAAFVAKVAGRE